MEYRLKSNVDLIASEIPESEWTPEIREAETALAAAKHMLDQITKEPKPGVDPTSKDVVKQITAQAGWDSAHNERVTIAERILVEANDRRDEVWFTSVTHYEQRFADLFNTAVAELKDYLRTHTLAQWAEIAGQYWTDEAHAQARLLGPLSHLERVRSAYRNLGPQADVISTVYDNLSRFCVLPDSNTAMRIQNHINADKKRNNRWLTLATWPGVEMKWQTRGQQEAQAAPRAVRSQQASIGRVVNTYA